MKMTRVLALFAAAVVGVGMAGAADPVPFRIHGQAWTEAGRIMESSRKQYGNTADSTDMDGASVQSTGAQIVVEADLGEKLAGSFGLGARQVSNSLGIYVEGGSPNYNPYAETFSTYRGYIAQANLTYTEGGRENPWLAITIGSFSHVYNRDAHNLGAYLLRGPVYPGLLMSGFQQAELDTAKATKVGARVHHRIGSFSHDLLFVNEHDQPPTFDWSLAYIAKYRAFGAIEVGAGVNLYRLIAYDKDLRTVDRFEPDANTAVSDAGDTTTYTHQGTKLMAMFSLDPKAWISLPGLGSEDLKLYGEAALLGVKNHGELYADRVERMPVMIGFNLPVFGYLDRLSVEVERYDSPYRNDLSNLGNPEGLVAPWRWNLLRPSVEPSPIPVDGTSNKDTWKWSVLAEKTVASHVRFTGQIASDHYRPLPFSTGLIYQPGGTEAALSSPKQWYFMGRLGFFF
jgi:hypothetical protein